MSSPVYYHEPFFSLNDFQRLLNDLSDAPTDRQVSGRDGKNQSLAFGFQPRMDIHESPEANLVTATIELPGMKKEEVHIDVRKGRLLVSGEQTFTKDVDEKGYIHRERRTGKFSRSLPLPAGTQPTDIKASMEDGVLTISFPKSSPEQLPQRITIS